MTDHDEETMCGACPRGEKSPAEFWWHPGSPGVFAECESCLRRQMVSDETRLDSYKRGVYEREGPEAIVAGYATPVGKSSPQMVTEEDLDDFVNESEGDQ